MAEPGLNANNGAGHGDDSDEEVYLSDPPSDDEVEDIKTDDDYEYHEEVHEDEASTEGEGEGAFRDAASAAGTSGASSSRAATTARAAALSSGDNQPAAVAAVGAAPAEAEASSSVSSWVAGMFQRAVGRAEEVERAPSAPAAPAAPAGPSGAPPKGLPGLPARPAKTQPKGGVGALLPPPAAGAPRAAGLGLGGGLPPRPAGGAPVPRPPAAAAPVVDEEEEEEEQQQEQPAAAAVPVAPAAPAGLPALFQPAPPAAAPAAAAAPPAAVPAADESPKVQKVRASVQAFRTSILRVALRLRYPTRSNMLQQLMYRLGMAERIHLGQGVAAPRNADEAALAEAERAEVLHEPLNFSATVLVLGLAGSGKSATIRSLLKQEPTVGYQPTSRVDAIKGEIEGIPVTFIDTPGLDPSPGAIASNLRKLHAVLRSITEVLGADHWFSTVVVLSHGNAPPPDNSAGAAMAFDAFVQQRSQQVQQALRQVAGDQRLMNPVALAENLPACPRNGEGEPVLPSGTPWRRQLLMLCFTTKVLTSANNLLKPGEGAAARRMANPYLMGMGMKVPPLGWLLSRLVAFNGPRKPPEDEREILRDDEIKRLPHAEQAVALRKKRAYMKQKADEARHDDTQVPILAPEPALAPSFDHEVTNYRYRVLEDQSGILTRPVVAEASIDHEDGVESVQASRTTRVEKSGVVRPRHQYLGGVPAVAWCQVLKDKQQFSFQGEAEGSYFHNSKWASTSGVNVQTIGRDVLYTPKLETRIKMFKKRNKATLGLLASKLAEDYSHPFKARNTGVYAYGIKLDDRIRLTPNSKLRAAVGRMYTKAGPSRDQGTALAGDLRIRPGGDETTRLLFGGTAVYQRRDVTIGGNASAEFRLPRLDGRGGKSDTTCAMNAQYNNKGNGNLSLRLNSHDYPALGGIMAVPLLRALWDHLTKREQF
eukprot:scaffold19.g1797.t1